LLEPNPQSIFVQRRIIDRVRNVRASILDFPLLRSNNQVAGHRHRFSHLAGVSVENSVYERPHESFEVNIRGTYNVLDACRENAKLVKTGHSRFERQGVWGTAAFFPTTKVCPSKASNPYDVSKSCADMPRSQLSPELRPAGGRGTLSPTFMGGAT